MILDKQSVATGYVPSHKIKSNFFDFYWEFVRKNSRHGSRHLISSYNHFKKFVNSDFISSSDITESLCEAFRAFLLKKYNDETPANYFREFKRMMKAAKKAGYFIENPSEELACKTKANKIKKAVLEPDEYIKLIKTPCLNRDTRRAFIFCLYAGEERAGCSAVQPISFQQKKHTRILTCLQAYIAPVNKQPIRGSPFLLYLVSLPITLLWQ